MSELSFLLVVPATMLAYAILRSVLADGLCREANKRAREKRFGEALDLFEAAKKINSQNIRLTEIGIVICLLIIVAAVLSALWSGGAG